MGFKAVQERQFWHQTLDVKSWRVTPIRWNGKEERKRFQMRFFLKVAPNRATEESWVRVEKIWNEKVTIVLRRTIKRNDEEHSVMIRKLVRGPYQCSSFTIVVNSQCPSVIVKLVLSC